MSKIFQFVLYVVVAILVGAGISAGTYWWFNRSVPAFPKEPSIFIQESPSSIEEVSSVYNCTDSKCFFIQLKTCAVSKFKTPDVPQEVINQAGITPEVRQFLSIFSQLKFEYSITGIENNNCLLDIKTVQAPEELSFARDKYESCKIPKGNYTGNNFVNFLTKDYCKGNLGDAIQEFAKGGEPFGALFVTSILGLQEETSIRVEGELKPEVQSVEYPNLSFQKGFALKQSGLPLKIKYVEKRGSNYVIEVEYVNGISCAKKEFILPTSNSYTCSGKTYKFAVNLVRTTDNQLVLSIEETASN